MVLHSLLLARLQELEVFLLLGRGDELGRFGPLARLEVVLQPLAPRLLLLCVEKSKLINAEQKIGNILP